MDDQTEPKPWKPRRDDNGAPMELPPLERLDRSEWPEHFDLKPTYEETSSYFWIKSHELHKRWLKCYDEFIDACEPVRAIHSSRYLRSTHHQLFARLFGFDFPFQPWLTKSQHVVQLNKLRMAEKQKQQEIEESGPPCPDELKRRMAEAAKALDVQPSLYDAVVWVSEQMTVVRNLGWETLDPKDVIGLAAFGMLQEAVEHPTKFYKEMLLPLVSKARANQNDPFTDSGSEQIEYIREMEKYLEAAT